MRIARVLATISLLVLVQKCKANPAPIIQVGGLIIPDPIITFKRLTRGVTKSTKSAEPKNNVMTQSLAPPPATLSLEQAATTSETKAKGTGSIDSNVEPEDGYVDVYGCGDVNVKTLEELGKVKYGCLYQGRVSYYINVGLQAVGNLSYILKNNDTYTKNYDAYSKKLQEHLLTEFGEWLHFHHGQNYYQCKDGPKHFEKCIRTATNGFEGGQCVGTLSHLENMYIPPDKLDEAAHSLSTFYNATINATSMEPISLSQNIYYDDTSFCTFTIKNVTGPKAADIMPNPMISVSQDNITQYMELLNHVSANVGKVNPFDLEEYLHPIPMLATTARSVMDINQNGALIRKQEAMEKKMMIITIVFAIVGAATSFLGAIESAVANVLLNALESLAMFSVLGDENFTGKDALLSLLIGSVGEVFSVFRMGLSMLQGAKVIRFSKMGGASGKMMHFSDYKMSLETLYGVSINSASYSQN